MTYILASSSPRRRELMKFISSSFLVDVSNADESVDDNLSIKEKATAIAFKKGEVVAKRHPEDLVISADTIVVIDNQIIGKPKDEEDAKRILRLLSGRSHYVLTAYHLFYKNQHLSDVVESEVIFNEIDDKLINDYVASGSPLDKAGAYGVQDNERFPIIKKVIGSINNVVGFPVEEIKESIKKIEVK